MSKPVKEIFSRLEKALLEESYEPRPLTALEASRVEAQSIVRPAQASYPHALIARACAAVERERLKA